MATLFKASGGTTTLIPGTTWAAPNALFPTTDRNDSSAYTWTSSTSTVTLPSSGLADGYLFVGAFEFEDTSNGRHNPQGQIVQASGTGNFEGGPTGGYNRDNSEDRAYVRCWAFVDSPSASATFQFQWKRDADTPTGGTVRSEIQVIPFYYSNIGMYSSGNTSSNGGTTPNQLQGWNVTYESDTAAIEKPTSGAANTCTLKTDNKRYLMFGSYFYEGRGGRTQRWGGFEIDSVYDRSMQGYTYYRDTSNDESGEMFTGLLNRVTTDIEVEIRVYRGDGVSNLQGGANIDGTAPAVGDHAWVVIELNDDAEVFRSHDPNQSALLATTGPVDLDCNETVDFNDTASFTDLANTSINCVQTADYLFGANISVASNAVTVGTRWTAYSEFTINGTEDSDSVAGDYMRNNQSSNDTFGWSANLLGFQGLTAGDDVGVSVTELAGSEGGGAGVSPAGWQSFWGINLDTLEAGGTAYSLDCDAGSIAITGIAADLEQGYLVDANAGSLAINGTAADLEVGYSLACDAGSIAVNGADATFELGFSLSAEAGSISLTGADASLEYHRILIADAGSVSLTGQDVTFELGFSVSAEAASIDIAGSTVDLEQNYVVDADSTSVAISGQDAELAKTINLDVEAGAVSISGADVNFDKTYILGADAGSITVNGADATLQAGVQLLVDAGSLAITAPDVGLTYNRVLASDVGSVTISGSDVTLETGIQFSTEAGSIALSGSTVTFLRDYVLQADAGSVGINGSDAALGIPLAEANKHGAGRQLRREREEAFRKQLREEIFGKPSDVEEVEELEEIPDPVDREIAYLLFEQSVRDEQQQQQQRIEEEKAARIEAARIKAEKIEAKRLEEKRLEEERLEALRIEEEILLMVTLLADE